MKTVLCPVCGADSKSCLSDRPDFEYEVKIALAYHCCNSPCCKLVFADPIPLSQIPSFYKAYSTHDQRGSEKETILSRYARSVFVKEFVEMIGGNTEAKILDYGCGNGRFLNELQDAGFRNAIGYDFDQKALEAARLNGARVIDGDEDFKRVGPFDVITMNHVVEHLADPVFDLDRLSSLLSPNGRIIIRTPNAKSALSSVLGDRWRGWETPRHLHIFNPNSISNLVRLPKLSHLSLSKVSTSNAMFFGIFHESLRHPVWKGIIGKLARHFCAFVAFAVISLINGIHRGLGEELVVELRI